MRMFCDRDTAPLPRAKPGYTLARPGHCLDQEKLDIEPEFDHVTFRHIYRLFRVGCG